MAHSRAAGSTPEARLKKLRRLESNMRCPNCDTEAPMGIGFGNVCVKFSTFVCDLCKTSHQAISHRVKSITMSNWTAEEVDALTDAHFGGNDAARHIWLKNAPPCGGRYSSGSRPQRGDRIDVFKKFVQDCYDCGMFRAEDDYSPGAATAGGISISASEVPAAVSPSRREARLATASAPAEAVPQSQWQPFDAFGSTSSGSGVTPSPAAATGSLIDDSDFFTSSGNPLQSQEAVNPLSAATYVGSSGLAPLQPVNASAAAASDSWSPFTDSTGAFGSGSQATTPATTDLFAPFAAANNYSAPSTGAAAGIAVVDPFAQPMANSSVGISNSSNNVADFGGFSADPFASAVGKTTYTPVGANNSSFTADPFANAPSFAVPAVPSAAPYSAAPAQQLLYQQQQQQSMYQQQPMLHLSVPLAQFGAQPYIQQQPQYQQQLMQQQLQQPMYTPHPAATAYGAALPTPQYYAPPLAPAPFVAPPVVNHSYGMAIPHRADPISAAFSELSPSKLTAAAAAAGGGRGAGVSGASGYRGSSATGGNSFDFLQDAVQQQLNHSNNSNGFR